MTPRVLIVDDETSGQLFSEVLKAEGYGVELV
jgi:hypothetical protein